MAESQLPPEVELALQHAVVEANSPFSHSQSQEAKKSKKRQKRTKDDSDLPDANQEDKPKKKKKKDKHSTIKEGILQQLDGRDGVDLSSGIGQGHGPVDQANGTATDPVAYPLETDPQLSSVSGSSTPASPAAFLSAVVAAAASTVNPNPGTQSFPPFLPDFQNQFTSAQNPAENISLSDLAFGSNEDVLRAFQELDVNKIAQVLKTLGDAAAAANGSLPGLAAFPTNPPPISTSSSFMTPESSTSRQVKEAKGGRKRTINMSLPGPEQHTIPEHAHWLSTRWMNPNKLAEMVRTEGLVYKKGKFSAIEDQQLNDAIEKFRVSRQMDPNQINDLIFLKNDKSKDNAFWSEITAAVPLRPIIAVYHHVRRVFHPMKLQGKWSEAEDALLKKAIADLGQQWEKVSLEVGRMSSDCRDRYRNHIANRETRVSGQWKPEEEAELTRIVTEMTVQQGKDIENDVFWGKVSERMGNKRGRQQCRIKWTDSLSKTIKNEGQKPRWSQQDAYVLVHKVDSLNVRDDTEIDWKTLSDPHWNLWSAHSLQRRWLTLKKGVKGHEDMTHSEIMDILRSKLAQLPSAPAVPSRRRKVTSAAAIEDQDLSGDSGEPAMP